MFPKRVPFPEGCLCPLTLRLDRRCPRTTAPRSRPRSSLWSTRPLCLQPSGAWASRRVCGGRLTASLRMVKAKGTASPSRRFAALPALCGSRSLLRWFRVTTLSAGLLALGSPSSAWRTSPPPVPLPASGTRPPGWLPSCSHSRPRSARRAWAAAQTDEEQSPGTTDFVA